MGSFLRRLFQEPDDSAPRNAYIALVEAARNPFFYENLAVPDTLDGRFELVLLHLWLLQHRLLGTVSQNPQAEEFSRIISESFFADMDRSLRELGVADTGVRYRIKAMAKAYHGRLQVYTAASGDRELLKTALARNLYGTVADGSPALLEKMGDYVERCAQALAAETETVLLSGSFPETLFAPNRLAH